MKKKIFIMSVLAAFILVTISFASAVSSNTKNVDNKESPLYKLRTTRAIGEKIGNIIEDIKTKFFEERVFFIPFILPGSLFYAGINDFDKNEPVSGMCYTRCCTKGGDPCPSDTIGGNPCLKFLNNFS